MESVDTKSMANGGARIWWHIYASISYAVWLCENRYIVWTRSAFCRRPTVLTVISVTRSDFHDQICMYSIVMRVHPCIFTLFDFFSVIWYEYIDTTLFFERLNQFINYLNSELCPDRQPNHSSHVNLCDMRNFTHRDRGIQQERQSNFHIHHFLRSPLCVFSCFSECIQIQQQQQRRQPKRRIKLTFDVVRCMYCIVLYMPGIQAYNNIMER